MFCFDFYISMGLETCYGTMVFTLSIVLLFFQFFFVFIKFRLARSLAGRISRLRVRKQRKDKENRRTVGRGKTQFEVLSLMQRTKEATAMPI